MTAHTLLLVVAVAVATQHNRLGHYTRARITLKCLLGEAKFVTVASRQIGGACVAWATCGCDTKSGRRI